MRVRLLALVTLALLQPAAPALAQNDGGGNLAWIAGNDPDMAAAVRQARQGLTVFSRRWQSPLRTSDDFALKFNLAPKGDAEFIWADQLRLEGGRLTGVLTDDPLTAGCMIGQRVPIADADIIDRTYFKGRAAQGHVTTRVLLKQMPRNDANGVRDYLGWPEE